MKRIKLIVAYDGTNYKGWQVQLNGVTIEGELNKHLSELLEEDIKVIGASRTDSGVHALGNVAVFDTNAKMPGEKISYALNQRLPQDIKIQVSEEVEADFHPRKCSSIKTYEYRIYNAQFPLPTERLYAHFTYCQLDEALMKEACAYLTGEHDFKSFCSINTDVETTVRNILSADIVREGNILKFTVSGNGFLYNMVRIIVGTLMDIGQRLYEPADIRNILAGKDRNLAGPTAPANGLTLNSIRFL